MRQLEAAVPKVERPDDAASVIGVQPRRRAGIPLTFDNDDDLRLMVAANRGNVDATMANLRGFSEGMTQLVDRLDKLIASNQANVAQGIANIKDVTGKLETTAEQTVGTQGSEIVIQPASALVMCQSAMNPGSSAGHVYAPIWAQTVITTIPVGLDPNGLVADPQLELDPAGDERGHGGAAPA